jgi:hypothetical protein
MMSLMVKRTQAFVAATLIAVASIAGGRERAFRVVTVRGTRVHLRNDFDVPVQLGHQTVKRHLRRGEAFYTERAGIGISYDGRPDEGVWFYCVSLSDRNDQGWINARYLVETEGHYSPDPPADPAPVAPPTSAPPATPAAAAPALQPRLPVIPQPSPWLPIITNLVSIISDLFALVAALLSITSCIMTATLLRGRPAVPSTVVAQAPLASHVAIPIGGTDSILIYGSGNWWASTTPQKHRRTHDH